MTTRFSRRGLLARAAALGVAASAAALAGRSPLTGAAEYGGDCDMSWGRDARPYKGFASTREGSGGQCTTHAARRFDTVAPEPGLDWNGNARAWLRNAAARGWVVGDDLHAARSGTVVVWGDGLDWNGPGYGNGHVAYVESVWPEGFTVSEMNWGYLCPGASRFRTSMWGIVGYTFLTWEEARQRGQYRFAGFIYPERRAV